MRFASSIKTATHIFHNKKINIQIKTAKPNGKDLLQANIQFGFAYWLHDSYTDFKNPSNRLLWWFFYFLKGIPKWFLSNLKHQLLQTHTHTNNEAKENDSSCISWCWIRDHHGAQEYKAHTQRKSLWMWLSWFSSKWFAFCYDFVRCFIMYFPICCKWFIVYSSNSGKKYITLAKSKKPHICACFGIQHNTRKYSNRPLKCSKNKKKTFHINASRLGVCVRSSAFLFQFVEIDSYVPCRLLANRFSVKNG